MLAPFLSKFVKDFIDDFCVHSDRASHCAKLETIISRYDECGGQLNPKKCHLASPRVKLLGHIVSENGIEADPDKVKALVLLPSPRDSNIYSKGEVSFLFHSFVFPVALSFATCSKRGSLGLDYRM